MPLYAASLSPGGCGPIDQDVIHEDLDTLRPLQCFHHLSLEVNGSRLYINLANGVMKVVSLQLSGCNSMWKKPLAASSEKDCSPTQLAVISSVTGRIYCSLFTASFSLLRSTQMRALPVLFFRTGTIGAHQLVAVSLFP